MVHPSPAPMAVYKRSLLRDRCRASSPTFVTTSSRMEWVTYPSPWPFLSPPSSPSMSMPPVIHGFSHCSVSPSQPAMPHLLFGGLPSPSTLALPSCPSLSYIRHCQSFSSGQSSTTRLFGSTLHHLSIVGVSFLVVVCDMLPMVLSYMGTVESGPLHPSYLHWDLLPVSLPLALLQAIPSCPPNWLPPSDRLPTNFAPTTRNRDFSVQRSHRCSLRAPYHTNIHGPSTHHCLHKVVHPPIYHMPSDGIFWVVSLHFFNWIDTFTSVIVGCCIHPHTFHTWAPIHALFTHFL